MDFNWLGEYIIPFFLKSVKVVFLTITLHPHTYQSAKEKARMFKTIQYSTQFKEKINF